MTSKGGRKAQKTAARFSADNSEVTIPLSTSHDSSFPPEFFESFRAIFNRYGEEGIPLNKVLNEITLESRSGQTITTRHKRELLNKADRDGNGCLSFDEFRNIMSLNHDMLPKPTKFQRAVQIAVRSVAPSSWTDSKTGETQDESYMRQYNCCPPPLFMITISIVEAVIFTVYAVVKRDEFATTWLSGVPMDTPLLYQPARRYEAWRFATYMFIHNGIQHIVFNLIFQLFLGIPLEMVHKFWRVGIIYILGVIAGSLGTSITDPWTLLCGASGGCYALLGANLATIMLNWENMSYSWGSNEDENFMMKALRFLFSAPVRLTFWLLYVLADVGFALYKRYGTAEAQTTAYSAHFAGAIAGLLLGIVVLKNLTVKSCERVAFFVCLITYIVLVVFAIVFNAVYTSYYPATDWDPCCPPPKPQHPASGSTSVSAMSSVLTVSLLTSVAFLAHRRLAKCI